MIVDQFRADLGGANNGTVATTFANGRREVDWDAVADGNASPAYIAGDAFRSRGAVFTTPGTGFQVSMDGDAPPDPDTDQVRFSNLHPSYGLNFTTFSAQRLFTSVGSRVTDVTFRVPGTNSPATVKGFGVVFTDVDTADLTIVEFFDERGLRLGPPFFSVSALPSPGGLSLVGVSFDAPTERIARVRIRAGEVDIAAAFEDGPFDVVAIDDLIYSEPRLLAGPPAAIDTSFGSDGVSEAPPGAGAVALALLLQPDGKVVLVGPAGNQVGLVRLDAGGSLDTTFDGDGRVTAGSLSGFTPRAAALQPDGRIIVVGDDYTTFGSNRDFVVMRFTTDGGLDPSFAVGGRLRVSFELDAQAHAVAVQSGGQILVAGQAASDIAVLRLLPDGALDPTFNTVDAPSAGNGNGRFRFSLGGNEFARAIVALDDGGIALAGGRTGNGAQDVVIVRLLSSGALDDRFDDDGWMTIDFGGTESAEDLLALPDGRLVAAGSRDAGNGVVDFTVARVLPSGALDPSFNALGTATPSDGNGRVTFDFGAMDFLNAVAVQPDGRLVLAGWTTMAPGTIPNIAVARLTQEGVADTTFSGSGGAVYNWLFEEANDVAVRPDGRILVGGYTYPTDGGANRRQMSALQLIGGPTPGVFITSPTTDASAPIETPFAALRGTAGDDMAVTAITWSTDRGFSGTAEGTTAWSADVPMLGGVNVVTVTARDADGNSSTDTITLTVSEFSYYLSEGATGSFFDLDVLIANPTDTTADIAVSYLKPDGTTVPQVFTLAGKARRTVRVEEVSGLEDTAVSAVVRSLNAVPLAVERTMFWDTSYYGGHTGNAVEAPRTRWLFGEGNQGFFDTYVLLANANDATAVATITYLVEGGPNVAQVYTVAPTSRLNVYAGLVPQLAGKSFSIVVTSTLPIIAERAMYFGQRLFEGGHESAGVADPSTTWFHAEGATGAYFDTYVLVGNPNPAAATLTFTFLKGDGSSLVRSKVVPANGRLTLFVDAEDPALADTAVSTTVVSDIPVVSERAMYWAGTSTTWGEAHNSFGVTRGGQKWALAEGRVGQEPEFETYVLIANPSTAVAQVRATFLRSTGTPIVKTYDVLPTSRFNIWVNAMVPELADEDFGVLVEVINGIDVVVERAMYWSSGGVAFAGGTNATAVRIP
ncbi:hypothetical protein [Luteitalea sp.]